MGSQNVLDGLQAAINYIQNMSEEEGEQLARDFRKFCEDRDREGRAATRRYMDELREGCRVCACVHAQLERIIGALDSSPWIIPESDGCASLEWQDVFSGCLSIKLTGEELLHFWYADPFPNTGRQEGFLREKDVPAAVRDFYCRAEPRV